MEEELGWGKYNIVKKGDGVPSPACDSDVTEKLLKGQNGNVEGGSLGRSLFEQNRRASTQRSRGKDKEGKREKKQYPRKKEM